MADDPIAQASEDADTPATEEGRQAKTSRWQRFADRLASLRKVTVDALVLVSVLALVAFAVVDLMRDRIVIEEIALPEALQEQGFTGVVAANWLWDAMLKIQEDSGTRKEHASLLGASRQFDLVEPGSGVSLQALSAMLRGLFGRDRTRIAGEVICGDPKCSREMLSLHLRVFSGARMRPIGIGPVNGRTIAGYFADTALEVMKEVDPYTAAWYLYDAAGAHDAGVIIARNLVKEDHPQSAWAANLIGNAARRDGRDEAAIEWYERALTLSEEHGPPDFALPYNGWGNALNELRRHEEATQKFQQATELDPSDAYPWNGWGNSLGALGRQAEAIEKYRQATELDQDFAHPLNGWGNNLSALGRHEEAIEKYRRAAELDPSDAMPLENWGISLLRFLRENESKMCARFSEFGVPYLNAAGGTAPDGIARTLEEVAAWCR
ncbi:MAG: tetratricopeptide repeat protein [Rhodobacter sp.]|nr:tetratricopeptide repeat protein [Rhodobacter sp.]